MLKTYLLTLVSLDHLASLTGHILANLKMFYSKKISAENDARVNLIPEKSQMDVSTTLLQRGAITLFKIIFSPSETFADTSDVVPSCMSASPLSCKQFEARCGTG